MRAFVAIVDQGSLTAAAEALGRAPPTTVRTPAALEEHLGVRLLARTTRTMSLSEEGRVYLDRCRRILADVEEAEEAVAASDAEQRGEIQATAPILFGQWHVAPAVTRFLQRYPHVRVELLLLDRVIDLVEEGIDLGVRIGRLPDASTVAVPVGHVRRVVVASPGLLEQSDVPGHPGALGERPCVVHSGTTPGGRWTFRDGDRDLAVRVRSVFACNQAIAAVDACAAGLGFGCFLSYQVEPRVSAGELQVVLETFEPEPMPVQLVYPHARLMSPRLRVFVDALRDELRERPELRR
ncbi:MAG: LysR family transcriptional regulator [Myxococcota bacterium]